MNLSQETGAPVSVDEFMATKHLVLTEKNRGGIGLKEKIGDGGCSEGTGVFEGTEDDPSDSPCCEREREREREREVCRGRFMESVCVCLREGERGRVGERE